MFCDIACYPVSNHRSKFKHPFKNDASGKMNDRQFLSPCGFLATGGNAKKHNRTPTVKALVVGGRGGHGDGGLASVWAVGPS
jgi:hypothetical protein